MIHFGDVPAGSVLPVFFATYGKTNGESITLTGLAVTDIEIYKGVSMTQRASDAGYTLLDTDGIDVDSVTGIHAFSIDTGDNTDASFYAAGSFYTVVVSAVTIDSQTVNFVAATFRIVAAENTSGTPVMDVGRVGGTAQTARDLGASILLSSGTGTGQLSLSSGAVLLQATQSGVTIPTVTTLTNAPSDSSGTTTLLSRLSAARAGYLDNLSAGAVALEASLQALITTIGVSAAGVASAVWSAATRLLTAGTNIVLAKGVGVTGLNDLSAAQVNTEADTALSDYDGPTNTELATALGTADDATLAAIAALIIPTAAQNADAVWDEARSGHATAGTFGESYQGIVSGAALTGTLSTTQCTTDLTEATDDHYIGRTIVWISGVLTGQSSDITDYTGSTKLLTFTALTDAPSNGDDFVLV